MVQAARRAVDSLHAVYQPSIRAQVQLLHDVFQRDEVSHVYGTSRERGYDSRPIAQPIRTSNVAAGKHTGERAIHRAHRGWVCTACTLPQDRGSQYARCGPSSRSAAVYCSSRLTATRRRAVMTYRASYQWVGIDHAPCHCRRGQRPAVRASWLQTPTRLASVCNRANSGRAHWQQAPTPSGTAVRSAQNWYQPRCSCRKALLEPQDVVVGCTCFR